MKASNRKVIGVKIIEKLKANINHRRKILISSSNGGIENNQCEKSENQLMAAQRSAAEARKWRRKAGAGESSQRQWRITCMQYNGVMKKYHQCGEKLMAKMKANVYYMKYQWQWLMKIS
jgi:hypothetical protein